MSFPCAVSIDTDRHTIYQATTQRSLEADIALAEKLANKLSCPFCDQMNTAIVENNDTFGDEWYVRCDDCGSRTGYHYTPELASITWTANFKRRIK